MGKGTATMASSTEAMMEFSDYDLSELLEEAHFHYGLDPVAYGIGLQALDPLAAPLSPKQQFIYDRFVAPAMKKRAEKREIEDREERWRKADRAH